MKISVAMTTYNGASFLGEQLDSIFAQTRLPDELIVCDDRSDDATPRILEDYAARAPFQMNVVINEQRLGSTKNFEKAIGRCSGDLIFLADQDDVWRPHKIAIIEQRFDEEPDLGLVFTNGDLTDESGKRLRGDMWRSFSFHRHLQDMLGGPRAYDLLLSRPFITGATIAFRSRFRSFVLPIPEGIETFVHDRWIAVMIAAVAGIGLIDDKLIAYRLHPKQQLGIGNRTFLQHHWIPYSFSSDRRALTAMRQRLVERPSWAAKPEFQRALRVRQRHVAALTSFPRNPFVRTWRIVAEYRSGRYQRYPRGLRGALKDLLIGTR